jgi:hypothetical protein
VFAAALAPALAASEAMRRIITAEELTVRPAVAVAAAAAIADSVQHDPATGLLAARLAGRTVPALVLQQLGDGTATVQIEGEAMRVAGRLPAAGQSVLLRFPAPAAEPQSGPGFGPAPPATHAADVSVGALAHALSDAARARSATSWAAVCGVSIVNVVNFEFRRMIFFISKLSVEIEIFELYNLENSLAIFIV